MSEEFPGSEEYTPTRLDWLAVQLNSMLLTHIQNTNFKPIYFIGDSDKTITLIAHRRSNPNQEQIDDLINKIKSTVTSVAKIYEWDSWLEFEVRFIDEEIDE